MKPMSSIHAELKKLLLEEIVKSDVDVRLRGENAMARQFNVCRATVNKVMVELEREGYVKRLPGKGTFVSPRDKTVHGETMHDGHGTVIFAYPDFFAYSLWQEVHFAELAAMKRNYRLINFKMQRETNFKALFELIGQCSGLAGIMIMPPSSGLSKQVLRKLDQFNVPCVIRHHLEDVGIYRNIRTVDSDHFKSAYLRAKALLAKGHRKIAFLGNEPDSDPKIERGIISALAEYGLKRKDLIVPVWNPEPWSDGVMIGYRLALEVLDRADGVTAMIADTFPGAFGALRALYERNLRCPDDVSLITSMEMMNYTQMCVPALSCVSDSPELQIETMFDIVCEPGKYPARSFITDVILTERESIRDLN